MENLSANESRGEFRPCSVNPTPTKNRKGEPVRLSEVLPDVMKNIEKRMLQNKKGASQ